MTFKILELLESLDISEECVCCPVRDVCETPYDVAAMITNDIRNRSGCNGAEFDTWEDVPI